MSKENGTELTDSRIDSPEEKTAGAAKAGSGTLTEPGVKDEPQHVKQGKVTLGQLELMGIPYLILSEDTQEDEVSLEEIEQSAFSGMREGAAAGIPEGVRDAEHHIDFEKLAQINPDLYAWIRIPGTQIDYPVCQMVEGDQSFYLNHRADKVAEFAGAIYSENYNTRDFTDPVTVLYGHDMSNGSMFQNLHKLEDRAFFDNNKEVIIYLPDKVLHYRIFAAYNYNDDHLLLNHDNFKDENEFYFFLQDILAQTMSGYVDTNTELTRQSRILTLSTCNAYDDQRYLVQCLLMNPEAVMPAAGTAAESSSEAGASEAAQTQ